MRKKISEKNYIAVADWMVMDLNLNPRELLIYAIIYGFSQDGESVFSGSLSYLASWLNVSNRNNIRRTLNSLIEKGLIIKETRKLNDKQACCIYKVIDSKGKTEAYEHVFISTWMIYDIGLTGRELILYALIYGFSRHGSGCYCQASSEYFSKWLGVRKNHVKERYLNKLVEKGLISIESSPYENTKYRAIIPNETAVNSKSQIDHTFPTSMGEDKHKSQKDYTISQFDYNHFPKMTTNNLNNNLNNSLNGILYNNNINQNKTNIYNTKEQLSVVVNNEFDIDSINNSPKEKKLFKFKQQLDFDIYKKLKKTNNELDIAGIMQKIALSFYRQCYSYWLDNRKEIITSIYELFFKTLANKNLKGKTLLINKLSDKECVDLLLVAFDLNDPETETKVRKSKEAYMIGVMNNILEST